MKRTIAVGLMLSVALGQLPASAQLTPTETKGKVWGHSARCFPRACPIRRLVNVAGYEFKGRTRPSQRGQIVRFSFKRVGAKRWRPFKKLPAGGARRLGMYGFPTRAARIRQRGQWNISFVPYVRPGRFVVRARFPRQDGYRASATRWRVRVVGEGV